ncbi:histidine kinase [soil metagenome]
MSLWQRVRGWGRPSPEVVDALIAAGVFVVVLTPLLTGARPEDRIQLELTPGSFVLLTVACVALAFRRRALWPVWAVTTAVGLAACIEADGPTPVYAPAVIALATVASRSKVSHTAWATAAAGLLPVGLIVWVSDQGLVDSFAFGLTPWCGVAAMAGIAARSQRAVVAEALERAALAEARQEEEAQRRVAEERLRIARDLHDVVAHHISVVNVQSGVAQHLLRTDPDRAAEALAHVREASQTVLNEVPGLLGLLRTTEEEHPTAPTPTLAHTGAVVEQARRSGLDVTMRTTGRPVALSVSADLAGYRVLQESLTNAARHGTGQAAVDLIHDARGCRVTVRNPRPSSADAEPGPTPRHGLIGMTERVTASGGSITAGPDGRDWVVDVWLPADAAAPSTPSSVEQVR